MINYTKCKREKGHNKIGFLRFRGQKLPHFLTQKSFKTDGCPIFNSKKQGQKWLNQDKISQTATERFI